MFKKLRYFFVTCVVVLASSCSLDLVEDPNAVQLTQVEPNLLLNSVQRNFGALFNTFSTWGMQLTRLQNSGGTLYNNVFTPQTFDGVWTTAYASILTDADRLIRAGDANGLTRHAGMARVISAYTLVLLVDYFGDVPYSQAIQGDGNLNPTPDSAAQLYETAIRLLDEAIVNFNTNSSVVPTNPPFTDLFYGLAPTANFRPWRRAANTLKLKIFLNRRNVDPAGSTAGINALLTSADGLITAAPDNFVFRYGSNTVDPDNRHPRFTANYLTGAGNYMSNFLIWQMLYGYDAQQNGVIGDPRIRFYIFRQVNANSSNPNEIRCVTEATLPAHYPQASGGSLLLGRGGLPPGISSNPAHPAWARTYCYPSLVGYWGRDHVDPQGIPPDNLLRSTWGPYPAGGRFDANNPVGIAGGAGLGMRGAGIQPILMRSFTNFMLAEATTFLGTTGDARVYFENGMRASFQDVRDWTVNGTFGVGPASPTEATPAIFYPAGTYTTDVNTYVTAALAAYDGQAGAAGRMNFVAREYWIALFGNGIEAYNLYRRTALPTGMQPTISAAPGSFPRLNWYPQVFATLNANATQRTNLGGRVFWDTNQTNLDF
jgi:hypothetical protein